MFLSGAYTRRNLSGLDDTQPVPLDVLTVPEATSLFQKIAGPQRASDDDDLIAGIVAMCGHLPLAIRIVAARMSHPGSRMSAADMAGQLRRAHGSLAHPRDEDRSLAGVLGVSYRCLPPAEQAMFGRLGLIPGPSFDAYAAAAVAGVGLGTAEVLLRSLLDQNLLIQHTDGRYSFHDLIRIYAKTTVAAPARDTGPGDLAAAAGGGAGQADAALNRLLSYYLHAAGTADQVIERRIPFVGSRPAIPPCAGSPEVPTSDRATAWMAAELANLEAAADYAAGHGRAAQAAALSAAIAQHLRARGPWTQAIALHRRVLRAAAAAGDVAGQAQGLALLGVIQRQTGALRDAKDSLTRSAELYERLGDARSHASVQVDLGITLRLTAALADAELVLAGALHRYRDLGDRLGQAAALSELGIVQRQRGAFADARTSLAESLELYRGNRPGEAAAYAYLGSVELATGDMAASEESLTSALDLFDQLGDPIGQANCLLYLGLGRRLSADWAAATTALTDALDLYERLGDKRGQAGARAYLGAVHLAASEYDLADQSLTAALRLFRELGDTGGEAETLSYHAALAAATLGPAQARERYAAMLRLAGQIGSPKDEADALDGIAGSYRSEGDYEQAAAHYRQALALYSQLKCHADAARAQAALNELAPAGSGSETGGQRLPGPAAGPCADPAPGS